MDEVALFNRALSTNEISNLYAAGHTSMCKGAEINGNSDLPLKAPFISLNNPADGQRLPAGTSILTGIAATQEFEIATNLATNGINITFLPPSVFSTEVDWMDASLRISGYLFEDFEDTTLIPGLTITYTGNGFNTSHTSLVQTLDFDIDSSWDGVAIASNDPNNNVPPDSGVAWAERTTFTFRSGAQSIGIGLSGFQSIQPPSDFPITNHRLYVNGIAVPADIETLAGTNWTPARSQRNAYLRVDRQNGGAITSIGFENISGNDFLHFDHLAVMPAANQPTVTTNRITFVTVNGAPVDALDPAGNFFSAIEIKPGQNVFEVVATDSFSQSTTNTITVYGTTCPQNFASLGEVRWTPSLRPRDAISKLVFREGAQVFRCVRLLAS